MILIVDDHQDVCRALARLLRKHGHTCAMAFDGRSALATLELDRTALIVLDWMMPGMGGADVLRSLACWSRHRGVPIIVYTAGRIEQVAREAMALGASAVISKSLPVEQLLAGIAQLMPAARAAVC